ncbi:MAG: hypothetical protein AB7O98_19150 [Hyphomonadaceae bacterium]
MARLDRSRGFVWLQVTAAVIFLGASTCTPVDPPTTTTPEREVPFVLPASCYVQPSDALARSLEAKTDGELDEIVRRCAGDPERRVAGIDLREQIANGEYHAGRASRILASRILEPEGGAPAPGANAASELSRAVQLLDSSASAAGNYRVAPFARLELARAYRLQDNAADAENQLRRIQEQGAGALSSSALTYERAMLAARRIPAASDANAEQVRAARAAVVRELSMFRSVQGGDPYARLRGPRRLAELANELGVEYLNMPVYVGAQAQQNLNASVEFLDLALAAISSASSSDTVTRQLVSGNLGRARLRRAALLADASNIYVECGQRENIDPRELGEARRNFRDAGSSAVAQWGLACITLTTTGNSAGDQNALQTATEQLNSAVRTLASSPSTPEARGGLTQSELYVALGRALARRRMITSNTTCSATQDVTYADCAFRLAAQSAGQPERRIQIDVERALLYKDSDPTSALGLLDSVLCGVVGGTPADECSNGNQQRVQVDPIQLAEARLAAASIQYKLYQELGGTGRSRADQNSASRYLAAARNNLARATQTRDWPRLPEAFFERSLVEQALGNRDDAVDAADGAVRYGTQHPQYESYRLRACLIRIKLQRPSDQGEAACSPTNNDSAEWHLYNGLYWFAMADHRAGARRDNWGRAMRAFEAGQRAIERARFSPDVPVDVRRLADMENTNVNVGRALDFGVRQIRTCAGLGEANEGAQTSPESRRFFANIGIHGWGCPQ